MDQDLPIGVFDSGVGGLTVLKEIHSHLPSENIIYLGDTARVPYGTKSPEMVVKYVIRNTLFLLEKKIKALVIACNTASAHGLDVISRHFSIPVIGVIEPGVNAALQVSKTKKIGVIATPGTIQSQAYQNALKKKDKKVSVVTQSCPLLVALAEEGWVDGEIVEGVLDKYLSGMKKKAEIDTLILGCTHYPLFKKEIQNYLGPKIRLVDSATQTALSCKEMLAENNLLRKSKTAGKIEFFSTDAPARMELIGPHFLGFSKFKVNQVDIDIF